MSGNNMPHFTFAYHRFEAPVLDYDALYEHAFKQIGERTVLSKAFITFNEPIFTMTRGMEAIQSRYDALPLHMKHPVDQHNHWMRLADAEARAFTHFADSIIGFEPTDHSDAPPYISITPNPKANVCIDFGFEPTEGCE